MALPLFLLGWRRHWPKVVLAIVGLPLLWSVAAFLTVRFLLDMNGRLALPAASFLASGGGKVLDMGAGTGRSTLMVLEARPRAFVVALDTFGEQYAAHFGGGGTAAQILGQGRARLFANLKAAGVERRASIEAGDVRQMPFAAATFDGIVSTYTFEHLGRRGTVEAMSEAARVLKPGGEFLLMVLANDAWLKLIWGPLAVHGGLARRDRWETLLHDAGFQMMEEGARPATFYFLARKP